MNISFIATFPDQIEEDISLDENIEGDHNLSCSYNFQYRVSTEKCDSVIYIILRNGSQKASLYSTVNY